MKKKQYVFVDSRDLLRVTYDEKREFSFNDFDNVYYETGYESINGIFEQNGVPEEYRWIILEISDDVIHCLKHRNGIEEIVSKDLFTLNSINSVNGNIVMNCSKDVNDITKTMHLSAETEIHSYDDVLLFLGEMNRHQLLDSYFCSIMQFFKKDLKKEYQGKIPMKLTRKIDK